QKHGLAVELRSIGTPVAIAEHERFILFDATRELLFNVVKHAGVREARLRVVFGDDSLTIEVSDDGRGFDPDAVGLFDGRQDGFGLFSIGERLQALNGHLTILSSPEAGTCCQMTLPVEVPPKPPPQQLELPFRDLDRPSVPPPMDDGLDASQVAETRPSRRGAHERS
ncbi:MAG: ATP-binding protein, partial [Planctomycetes bacterium]|nr:ATP-binding protein [Planctomycetota bacterium]